LGSSAFINIQATIGIDKTEMNNETSAPLSAQMKGEAFTVFTIDIPPKYKNPYAKTFIKRYSHKGDFIPTELL
jgi:hypothetical protein